MRKWRVTLPGNKHFEMESDNPSADLTAKGYDAFGLTEITGLNIVETASRAPEEPMLLTPPQLAALWQIGKNTAYELCHREDFPCVRIGRSIRINRSQLQSWLDKHGGILL